MDSTRVIIMQVQLQQKLHKSLREGQKVTLYKGTDQSQPLQLLQLKANPGGVLLKSTSATPTL